MLLRYGGPEVMGFIKQITVTQGNNGWTWEFTARDQLPVINIRPKSSKPTDPACLCKDNPQHCK